jgi:DNA-binding NarL/FixJ family response regulator
MLRGEKEFMDVQSDTVQPVISVCSLHPLVAQTIREVILTAETPELKTRMLTTFQAVQAQEHGALLFLDGCCNDRWPTLALRWQRSGGKVLVLLSAQEAHPGNQLRALFLGVKGVIVTSGTWQNEMSHAIRAVLEGRLWISREVLDEYVRRISFQGRNRSGDLDPASHLTAREEQVMSLLLRGDSNKEIGDALGIAERTVKYHVSNILQKFQVSGRKELAENMTKDKDKGRGNLGALQSWRFRLREAGVFNCMGA